MKTYQSITSLATSPAISSNSLYSNGFFVTLTPPPPVSSNNNNYDSNINSTSSTSTTTTAIAANHSAMTPIVNRKVTATTTMTTTTTTFNSFENSDDLPQNHLQSDGDPFFVYINPYTSPNIDQQKHNDHNDINILTHNYDQKMLNCSNKQNEFDDDDELSVENTRL